MDQLPQIKTESRFARTAAEVPVRSFCESTTTTVCKVAACVLAIAGAVATILGVVLIFSSGQTALLACGVGFLGASGSLWVTGVILGSLDRIISLLDRNE